MAALSIGIYEKLFFIFHYLNDENNVVIEIGHSAN